MNKKLIRIGLLVVASAIVVMLTLGYVFKEGPFEERNVDRLTSQFITANPLDLSEISSISQFRSCMGHDYSGKNINGEKETNRSMKHYLGIRDTVPGNRAKVFAPFHGTIIAVESEGTGAGPGRGTQVWIRPDAAEDFAFIFFHMDLVSGLSKESRVQSGQLIGYANTEHNFDIGLKKFERFGGPNIFDSPFNYMESDVLADYEKKGVTPQNIIISKEQRDAAACRFGGASGTNEQIFLK